MKYALYSSCRLYNWVGLYACRSVLFITIVTLFQKSKTELNRHLEEELWSVAVVPSLCQSLLDSAFQSPSSQTGLSNINNSSTVPLNVCYHYIIDTGSYYPCCTLSHAVL